MSPERARRWFAQHMTLTKQVALLSLVPVVALGFILTRVLEKQVVDSSVHDASQSARLIAQIGIQPRLSPQVMLRGLDARGCCRTRPSAASPVGGARPRANQDLERPAHGHHL